MSFQSPYRQLIFRIPNASPHFGRRRRATRHRCCEHGAMPTSCYKSELTEHIDNALNGTEELAIGATLLERGRIVANDAQCPLRGAHSGSARHLWSR